MQAAIVEVEVRSVIDPAAAVQWELEGVGEPLVSSAIRSGRRMIVGTAGS